jgi:hypothetical protein
VVTVLDCGIETAGGGWPQQPIPSRAAARAPAVHNGARLVLEYYLAKYVINGREQHLHG